MSDILNNIEKKKLAKESGNDNNIGTKKSNWLGFILSIFYNFIIVIIISIIGSNFIYFTTSNNLDIFFPTNIKNYLNIPSTQKGGKFTCPPSYISKTKGLNKDVLKSFAIGDVRGFPYSLYVNDDGGLNFNSLKSWFASTIAKTYITNRGILKKILSIFKPFDGEERNILSSNTLQILLSVPFFALLIISTLITGFIVPFIEGFRNDINGITWSVIGIFTTYLWTMASSISFTQTIQNILTFLFIPLMTDTKSIFKILKCNSKFISILFGGLLLISAFVNLNQTTAIVMLITYILFIVKQVFF